MHRLSGGYEPVVVEQQQEEVKQKIEYARKRPNHKGRATLPAHLTVQEIEIHPEGDLSAMVYIGKEITEELLSAQRNGHILQKAHTRLRL